MEVPSATPSPSSLPPPPRVARKAGKHIHWWPADEGSLASRSIGKVNIDCRLRLSESKWGVLGGSQPAGVLYVDLTFDQPAYCRLSSATVLISLESCEDEDEDEKKDKEKSKEESPLSRLRVCEFGPKTLTGEPTTMNRANEYSFMPEINAGVGGFGGLGFKRQNAISCVSRWRLKGNTFAPVDKKRKIPGIVYRTLKWEVTENQLAFQPEERSVVHTAFAFEHELKRFYIKVEISGRLTDAVDRLKQRVFPPRLKKNQGSLLTLVDLDDKDKVRKENLDGLARKLEDQMRERNLGSLATKQVDDSDRADQTETTASGGTTGGVSLADLAKATEKFAPSVRSERNWARGPSLRPGMYTTSTSSFSSMASTLVPSQAEQPSADAPHAATVPVPDITNLTTNHHSQRQHHKDDDHPSEVTDSPHGSSPNTNPPTKTKAANPNKIPPNPKAEGGEEEEEEEEESSSTFQDCEEEPCDSKLGKVEEKTVRVIATELQFFELLLILRAWAYARFLAMFIRNQQQKQTGISAVGKGTKGI